MVKLRAHCLRDHYLRRGEMTGNDCNQHSSFSMRHLARFSTQEEVAQARRVTIARTDCKATSFRQCSRPS